MKRTIAIAAIALAAAAVCRAQETAPATQPATQSSARPTILLVIGAEGAPEFRPAFLKEADAWAAAAKRGSATLIEIGREPAKEGTTDKDQLHAALAAAALPTDNAAPPLYLVMIGHGTYDGKDAKLNLVGPDLSDSELADWLKPITRPVAVIDTTAASAPFLTRLSAKHRVLITATRAGSEINYARFGQYLAQAIADPAADIDKDGQTSLLEAFLVASRQTAEFYKREGRLATEHALLDDNADKRGTPADFYEGARIIANTKDKTPVDGAYAATWTLLPSKEEAALTPSQRERRAALEAQIETLRTLKSTMPEDAYYTKLDPLLLQLAKLYAE